MKDYYTIYIEERRDDYMGVSTVLVSVIAAVVPVAADSEVTQVNTQEEEANVVSQESSTTGSTEIATDNPTNAATEVTATEETVTATDNPTNATTEVIATEEMVTATDNMTNNSTTTAAEADIIPEISEQEQASSTELATINAVTQQEPPQDGQGGMGNLPLKKRLIQ